VAGIGVVLVGGVGAMRSCVCPKLGSIGPGPATLMDKGGRTPRERGIKARRDG